MLCGAQSMLKGKVFDANTAASLSGCLVSSGHDSLQTLTDSLGRYELNNIEPGNYDLICQCLGYKTDTMFVTIRTGTNKKNFRAVSTVVELGAFELSDKDKGDFGYRKLRPVDGIGIYDGKKSNVIDMQYADGNKSTNNARELYNQIAGLNIWESDGAGIQLGIGGRGLSPNRSSNFNVRQNGYDISADALGYPESYYTPPTEALDRIEIVRGAASLQYGTQFGGMVNFKIKKPFQDRNFGVLTRNTIGSNALYTNHTHLGGKIGLNRYAGFINYKQGNDFRPNSEFEQLTTFLSYSRLLSERTSISFEYTRMNYLAHQPGGLTDEVFYRTPYASSRDRNWFRVNWNVAAVNLDAQLSNKALANLKLFGLSASRDALGFLGRADRDDPGTERDLISGQFKNIGMEGRFLKRYGKDSIPQVFLGGFRLYRGNNTTSQGMANDADGPEFDYLEDRVLSSDFTFPSYNVSLFFENLFNLTKKLSITPGIRLEQIMTEANGYYTFTLYDLAGNPIEINTFEENRDRLRRFAILGLGIGYDITSEMEIYANVSQNYRAITFSDMRVVNTNFRIDEDIQDEKGFSADVGLRGVLNKYLSYDISGFYLLYNNRIGLISQVDETRRTVYLLRTNVASSRNIGVESYVNANLVKIFNDSANWSLNVFMNYAFIDARYIGTDNPIVSGNRVELAPETTAKFGVGLGIKKLRLNWQLSYTGDQFTDATNTEGTPDAINGLIPEYAVQDLSIGCRYKWFRFEGGINNLTDEVYFTRRASGYPGPGILPSPGRTYYATIQLSLP